ncbi:MAG: cell division protein ZipA C-terminal FtsZ-binding domain-containing protein [Gallionella sp.]
MSDLQIALLAIGFGVLVAVYVLGWWQQRRYRQKFGTAFKSNHGDALYTNSIDPPLDVSDLELNVPAASGSPAVESAFPAMSEDSCAVLDARSDFIIELHLIEPSPAAVLVGFWQRKFDFRKPVQVCGMAMSSRKWERVIAESHTLYDRFRVALQLVDRGGAISEAKLADFNDLVLGVAAQIKAQTTVPDIRAVYRHAVKLDEFCASVDQVVGVNLIPPKNKMIRALDISRAAALHGMTLEADGAFHLLDTQGYSLFSLINQDTVPFQHHTLETFATAGITFLLDVPRVEQPTVRFNEMITVAKDLAGKLGLKLVDDQNVETSDLGLESTRKRIAGVDARMNANAIAPGGPQARRLFS